MSFRLGIRHNGRCGIIGNSTVGTQLIHSLHKPPCLLLGLVSMMIRLVTLQVDQGDLTRVTAATGAQIQTTVSNLDPKVLGSCALFEEKQVPTLLLFPTETCLPSAAFPAASPIAHGIARSLQQPRGNSPNQTSASF